MASFWSILQMITVIIAYSCSLVFSSHQNNIMKISSISSAPSFLPASPISSPSPTLSPDISPLFPSPGGVAFAPADSSIPTIPSSPSPPNPDAIASPGPGLAFPPSESLPVSSSLSLHPNRFLSFAVFLVFLVLCMEICGLVHFNCCHQ